MSTTTKFTPGPWSAGKTTVFGPDDQDGHVTHIASVAGHNDHAPANAALIAAAPELYAVAEATEELFRELTGKVNEAFLDRFAQVHFAARSALAKARGEVVS